MKKIELTEGEIKLLVQLMENSNVPISIAKTAVLLLDKLKSI